MLVSLARARTPAVLPGAAEFTIQWRFALPMVPIAMATYYLAWKYLVGFLNEEVGIA
jgi:hypothetical protein